MADLNVVVMSGRLTRDPVKRATPKGVQVAAFRIASNQFWNGEDHPVFVDVNAFGKTADVVVEYFRKGDPILVRGALRLDQWTGKDGAQRSRHEIFAHQISFFAKGRNRGASGDVQGGDGEMPMTAETTEIPF